MDFHECVNNTDLYPGPVSTSAAVAAPAVLPAGQGDDSRAAAAYRHMVGAMPLGHDVVPPINKTFSEAVAICDAHPSCEGFTFEGPVEEHQPVKTYFKSSPGLQNLWAENGS